MSGLKLSSDLVIIHGSTAIVLLVCDILVSINNSNSKKWFNFVIAYSVINLVIVASMYFYANLIIAVITVYFLLFQLLVGSLILHYLIYKNFIKKCSKYIQVLYIIGVPMLAVYALYLNATRAG